MIYFTSDLHFNHANIIGYCNRPFNSLHEMHSSLINNWNGVVTKDDTVYMLGDFAFASKNLVAHYRASLNGRVVAILGNHDKSIGSMLSAGFDEAHYNLTLDIDGYKIYMSHIPIDKDTDYAKHKSAFVQRPPYHDYFLCGHVHDHWAYKGKMINVGVDVREYTPRTLQELIAP